MPRFLFSLNTDDVVEAGVVQSESLDQAMDAINERLQAKQGDTLEIGVTGFPPAHFECVWSLPGSAASWRQRGLLAA
ncbi:MAG TPA: hypothetical protein VFW98_05285 [Gemmatimonadaceae bacterium]|nr:hypothetical protein [Gemmatimonadaceae bacterium]